MNLPLATFINIGAILVGGTIGLLINKSLPDKIRTIVFQAIGLFSIAIGISMAIKMGNPLIIVFSLLLGGILGEALDLEQRIEGLSDKLKTSIKSKDKRFTEGLVTAFLLFCIGSMTIVGSISEGTTGDRTLLLTKSILDGFSSIALAATFGVGVLFSVIPMLILQGGLTLLAGALGNFIGPNIIDYLTCVGGILIVGIGINMLEIKKIKVINLLPALVFVGILGAIFG